MTSTRRFAVAVAIAASAGALTGCGGGSGAGSPAAAAASGASDHPGHVHGLGVAADGTLYVAAHTGLFRLAPDAATPERVSPRRSDMKGFALASPGRFLASGHPDPSDVPSNLGLVESVDGGMTWRSVSLSGKADFHVLRAAKRRVYGYDSARRILMASHDGGRTWRSRAAPEGLVDLVMERDADSLVATGPDRVYSSLDGGRNWREVAEGTGPLAWPHRSSLYLAASDGHVWRSPDGGRRWTRMGTLRGSPVALVAAGPQELYVALHGGAIKHSTDGGRTWGFHSKPSDTN